MEERTRRKRDQEKKKGYIRPPTPILDIILTSLRLTPRNHNNILAIQRRNHIVPLRNGLNMRPVILFRSVEHVALDGGEEVGDGLTDVVERDGVLGAGIAAYGEGLVLGEVVGSDFEAEGDTLEAKREISILHFRIEKKGKRKRLNKQTNLLLPIIKLIPRRIPLPQIRLGPNTLLPQSLRQPLTTIINFLPLLIRRLRRNPTRHHHSLHTRDSRG